MLAIRIIPCLDIEDGRVVKGIKFKGIKDAGDPVELAARYNDQGADELVFLDIGASYRSRQIMIDVVKKVSSQVFIPLTVGGGIRSVEDMRQVLNAGADKVSVCTSALDDPDLITRGAQAFGSQCIVLSIDAMRHGDTWMAYTHGGRKPSSWPAIEWAHRGAELGAGEILLNSIEMDGTQQGYDLELTSRIAQALRIPVIASGGAGTLDQIRDGIVKGKADAVLLASLLHYQQLTIQDIKVYLKENGVMVR
ncbi:MAG: imidazole glycerol phosphate synthase subunit HisF [Candidatus Delongbacteria bacterium]|nr:imidazole glycerol phosphate synthase subunit HisF [Candidatus Delongbacteria bacterium]